MPSVDVLISSPVVETFRVSQVRGMFDLPPDSAVSQSWRFDFPIETEPWQIGLIVGPSGSGKSVVARHVFKSAYFHTGYKWPRNKSVVDGFPSHLSGEDVTAALSCVGFSSPPHWLKPFRHLSNGQQFRAELARLMLENRPTVVCDEFTSVVDRDAAKISSAAISKALRKRERPQFVALSCHYDVVEWLRPDWVLNMATREFARVRLRRRPKIELRVRACNATAWPVFRTHHYLSGRLAAQSTCFVATWNGTPVAFTSYLSQMHATVRNVKREHRTVVLPDFQGVGIGVALSDWLGAYVAARGWRFTSVTSHPAMIAHRMRSPNWVLRRRGRARPGGRLQTQNENAARMEAARAVHSRGRITASFTYVGKPLNTLAAFEL